MKRRRQSIRRVLFVVVIAFLFGVICTYLSAWIIHASSTSPLSPERERAWYLVGSSSSSLLTTEVHSKFACKVLRCKMRALAGYSPPANDDPNRLKLLPLRIEVNGSVMNPRDFPVPGLMRELHPDALVIESNNLIRDCGVQAIGWPCLSLSSSYWSVVEPSPLRMRGGEVGTLSGVFPNPNTFVGRSPLVRLPLRPLFPGFLLNSALFGVLGLTLWYTPTIIRRIRRGRNACSSCGYDLSGLTADRCPECGAAVEARSQSDSSSPLSP